MKVEKLKGNVIEMQKTKALTDETIEAAIAIQEKNIEIYKEKRKTDADKENIEVKEFDIFKIAKDILDNPKMYRRDTIFDETQYLEIWYEDFLNLKTARNELESKRRLNKDSTNEAAFVIKKILEEYYLKENPKNEKNAKELLQEIGELTSDISSRKNTLKDAKKILKQKTNEFDNNINTIIDARKSFDVM